MLQYFCDYFVSCFFGIVVSKSSSHLQHSEQDMYAVYIYIHIYICLCIYIYMQYMCLW